MSMVSRCSGKGQWIKKTTPAANPTPHNQIYQQSWPDYPLPANRHQSLDELGRPAAHKEYQNAVAVMEDSSR